jgi:NADH-ubiquinone oxidoreductase chain 2
MYSVIIFIIVGACVSFKLTNLSNLENIELSNKTKILLSVNLLSLGGLPPFIGFLIKFMIINYIIQTILLKVLILVIIMMSLFSLFYYIKVSYGFMFKNGIIFKSIDNENKRLSNAQVVVTLLRNSILPGLLIFI